MDNAGQERDYLGNNTLLGSHTEGPHVDKNSHLLDI